MAFTYDLNQDTGRVRMLIPDRVENGHLFEDDEIQAFLSLEGSNRKRATALALETAASDHALVLKVIKLLDLSTNGPAVATSLLERAKLLREQADTEENYEDGGSFDIAEIVVNDFSHRERLWNEAQRDG